MPMTSTERSQRLRERQRSEGGKQVTLWLSPPLLRRSEAISEESGQPLNKILLSAVEFGLGIARDQLPLNKVETRQKSPQSHPSSPTKKNGLPVMR